MSDDTTPATTAAGRLSAHPDWAYLLREFYLLYRHQTAGGSKLIRSHQRDARARLNRIVKANPPVRTFEPEEKPVCAHLGRAIDNGLAESVASTVRALARVRHQLNWQYGYDRMPRGLADKFAYAEFLGPNGPVIADDLILGCVLFAPRCTYPAHSHDGITESYVCLSGGASENDAGVYAPGSMIFNPPRHQHRITTGDFEPTLLAYAWTGSSEKLAAPAMKFDRRREHSP